jgi:anti-anti-sigma regulatory factor
VAAIFVLGQRERADIPGACDQLVDRIREGGEEPVRCQLAAVAADLLTVELLLRLQLAARRARGQVVLEGVSPALRVLLDLCGLSGTVATAVDDSRGA